MIRILEIAGLSPALYGMGLSFGKTKGEQLCNMQKIMLDRANKNAHLGGGHNKFLESIQVWVEVTGTRGFWSEMDTYRLMTKQSDSTMHTLFKDCDDLDKFLASMYSPIFPLSIANEISQYYQSFFTLIQKIKEVNINETQKINIAKRLLPEGWQQTRVLCVSYKTLQNIYAQRHNHKLYEWREFCDELKQLPNSNWIVKE